jgi:hypothetical protein
MLISLVLWGRTFSSKTHFTRYFKTNHHPLHSLTTDTTSQLHVLHLNGNSLGVDRSQVGVLKQSNEIRLTCLLQRSNGRGLETEISLEVLSDLTNETLEGEFSVVKE